MVIENMKSLIIFYQAGETSSSFMQWQRALQACIFLFVSTFTQKPFECCKTVDIVNCMYCVL